jgi:type I restriction enzyme M protein
MSTSNHKPPSTPAAQDFSEAKAEFDKNHATASTAKCIVPVNGKVRASAPIRDAHGNPSEEYYKWQFVHSLIKSGLYAPDYIGVEVQFPKGNTAVLRLDGAIFDSPEWLEHYNAYWRDRHSPDLEWLNDHLLAVMEFKKNDKEIEKVFTSQVKPAMREKEPADAYILGIYFGAERLHLFHRRGGKYLRYDEDKNQKGDDSKIGDLSLQLPDPYYFIPTFDQLHKRVNRPSSFDRSKRSIADLDVITTIASVQVKDALSDVLRALDKVNLVDQRGYGILIQTFALKVFDEKRNQKHSNRHLEFYITEAEAGFHVLSEKPIQDFIKRMKGLREDAAMEYQKILRTQSVDWKDLNDVRAVVAICGAFQDYSFVRSAKSDLYQLEPIS